MSTLAPSAASGSADAPVTLSARVVNAGTTTVRYWEGCGVATGIRMQLFDPEGSEVYLHDPTVVPACADVLVTLAPGKDVLEAATFTGDVYVLGAGGVVRRTAPAGVYTVRTTFSYSTGNDLPSTAVTSSTTFGWTTP